MKKTLFLLFVLCLSGCATMRTDTSATAPSDIQIGMTKQQVFWLRGSPAYWSRQEIDGHKYESWTYTLFPDVYDFRDGVLVGHGYAGRYYSKEGVDDLRSYANPYPRK